jgi:hypothetical protein
MPTSNKDVIKYFSVNLRREDFTEAAISLGVWDALCGSGEVRSLDVESIEIEGKSTIDN